MNGIGQMRKIIIIGGGGHAKVLIEAIRSTGCFEIENILDPKLKIGTQLSGVPVIGGDEFLDGQEVKGFCLSLGLGSIRASDVRKNIFKKYKNRGFEFPAIVHGNAYVSKDSEIGSGSQVMAGVVIQPDAIIGENVIINTSAVIEHDCRIQAHSHIAPGAIIGGGVEVGECSHVGLGAKVLQGVKIGRNVTVGAGAVVIDYIEDGRTVKGVPAK